MNNSVLRIQPGGIRACDEEGKKKPALASPPTPIVFGSVPAKDKALCCFQPYLRRQADWTGVGRPFTHRILLR